MFSQIINKFAANPSKLANNSTLVSEVILTNMIDQLTILGAKPNRQNLFRADLLRTMNEKGTEGHPTSDQLSPPANKKSEAESMESCLTAAAERDLRIEEEPSSSSTEPASPKRPKKHATGVANGTVAPNGGIATMVAQSCAIQITPCIAKSVNVGSERVVRGGVAQIRRGSQSVTMSAAAAKEVGKLAQIFGSGAGGIPASAAAKKRSSVSVGNNKPAANARGSLATGSLRGSNGDVPVGGGGESPSAIGRSNAAASRRQGSKDSFIRRLFSTGSAGGNETLL